MGPLALLATTVATPMATIGASVIYNGGGRRKHGLKATASAGRGSAAGSGVRGRQARAWAAGGMRTACRASRNRKMTLPALVLLPGNTTVGSRSPWVEMPVFLTRGRGSLAKMPAEAPPGLLEAVLFRDGVEGNDITEL